MRPVLFGNKENDFACMCDDVVYILTEEQSSGSPNLPYRLLEYATTGLRSMVDSEQLLYGRKRVYFPIPKLYVLQVGLEAKAAKDVVAAGTSPLQEGPCLVLFTGRTRTTYTIHMALGNDLSCVFYQLTFSTPIHNPTWA